MKLRMVVSLNSINCRISILFLIFLNFTKYSRRSFTDSKLYITLVYDVTAADSEDTEFDVCGYDSINLSCRTVRIGSYKAIPRQDIIFSQRGVKIWVPQIRNRKCFYLVVLLIF